MEARRQSVSVPHDHTEDLAGFQAPVLLIHGRYDLMVPFEGSVEKPAEWTAQVLAFVQGY